MRRAVALHLALTIGVLRLLSGTADAAVERVSSNAPAQPSTSTNGSAGHASVPGVRYGRGSDAARPAVRPHVTGLDRSGQTGPASLATRKKSPARVPRTTTAVSVGVTTSSTQGATPSAPILGETFGGMADAGSNPPDPTMAVGPLQVVVATNDGYAAYEKNGTAVANTAAQPCLGSCSLFAFFSNAVLGTNIFDPWLVYDEYIQRFWFLAVSESDSPRNSDLLIALSNSDDVLDGWTLFGIDARTNGDDVQAQWCDYPKLGIDAQAIYLTCNMFTLPSATDSTFVYSKIRVMTKAQFIDDMCCYWWDWWDLVEAFAFDIDRSFTVQPAHMYGAADTDGMFFVNAMNSCVAVCPPQVLVIRHVTSPGVCCVPGHQHEPNISQREILVGAMDDPPNARQPGTTTRIDTQDTRLLNAVWQNGQLSTVQNIKCANENSVCAAFTELDVSSYPSIGVVTDMYIPPDGADRYYPSVAVNAAGNKTMVYARSSSSEFASAVYVGVPSSDQCTNCLDGPETILQAGLTSFVNTDTTGRNRWGDYMGSAPDPDGIGIWIHGEFAQISANRWATMVGLTYELPDATPPTTIASLSPLPTTFGWNNGAVLLTLNASDTESGVRRITFSATGAQIILATVVAGPTTTFSVDTPGITTVSFFAEDFWGNVEATRTQIVRVDETPPLATCGAADGVWHATDANIACTAGDALSGLASATDASFSLSTSVPAGTETSSACTGTRVVADRANNFTTAGPVCGNKVDKKAPTISISTPISAATYLLNQQVAASYSCADAGSGVASCVGPVPSGTAIDTKSVGAKTFTVSATDMVGNTRTASVSYVVTYKICLLYDPTRPFSGNSVPLRINLCDVNDVNVSSPGVILHATVVDPGAIPATSIVNPTNDFLFNSGVGGYTYVLNTKGSAPGTHELKFTVTDDPMTHSAPFILR